MQRPGVEQYFMDMTHLVKSRGTCPRRQVGAVVVKDKRVLTTGYNGAPRNFEHPCDVGCIRDELKIPSGMMADVCPCLHAEQNAILQAATTGVSIDGADLYCTTQPCTQCSRMIANCGIKRVIFEEEYADPMSIGLLVTAGVELWLWDKERNEARPYGNTNTWVEAQDALRKKWAAGEIQTAPKRALAPGDVQHQVSLDDEESAGLDLRPDDAQDPPQPERAEEPVSKVTHDMLHDPNREEKLREMAKTRKERLEKALREKLD